jgi:hypothetical protein
MGVIINHDDFDTFTLLKDLEQARDDLYSKQCELKKFSQIESVENESNNVVSLELEWLQDENSEIEDFILVESRKKKRDKRKNLKISPLRRDQQQDQEVPACKKKRERPCKATSSKKKTKNKKKE